VAKLKSDLFQHPIDSRHSQAMKTPESVLKKQATQAKIAEAKAAAEKAAAEKAKADAEKFLAAAQKYDEEYTKAEREAIENRRKAKAEGGFFVPAEPKIALVIRIRGTIGVSPKAKKVMQVRNMLGLP
jgi:large subunit ribosomal protein L7e